MNIPNEDPVINQFISWDTHGDPTVRGNERRGGYITALKDSSGYYSIRADAGEMQYMKRERFIAHFGYDKTPSVRK